MDIDENKAHFNLDDLIKDKPGKKKKKNKGKRDDEIDDGPKEDDFKVFLILKFAFRRAYT